MRCWETADISGEEKEYFYQCQMTYILHISKAEVVVCVQSQFEWFCQVIFCQRIGYTVCNYLNDLFYLSGCAHFVFKSLFNVIAICCMLSGFYIHVFPKWVRTTDFWKLFSRTTFFVSIFELQFLNTVFPNLKQLLASYPFFLYFKPGILSDMFKTFTG